MKSIRSEIYVDKTGLIAQTNRYLNTRDQYICVSRPRRFGKSMTLKMLVAYYSRGCDSADLFSGFQIEKDGSFREQEVLRELKKEYEDILTRTDVGLASALREIFVETDRQFIFLIDEWDCVMRERQESEDLQKQYLDFLRNLLKDQPYMLRLPI